MRRGRGLRGEEELSKFEDKNEEEEEMKNMEDCELKKNRKRFRRRRGRRLCIEEEHNKHENEKREEEEMKNEKILR